MAVPSEQKRLNSDRARWRIMLGAVMFLCTLGIMMAAPRAHPRPPHSAVMGCRTKTRDRDMRCLLSLGSCRLASTAKPRSWNEQAPRAPAPRPPRAARARPRPPRGTARPRSMGPPPAPRPRQAPRARPRPPRGAARPPHILLPMFLGSHLLIFSQKSIRDRSSIRGDCGKWQQCDPQGQLFFRSCISS